MVDTVSGNVVYNCAIGRGASAAWFLNEAGGLSTFWRFYNPISGQYLMEGRYLAAPSRGTMYGTMPCQAGYQIISMTWSFTGSGYLSVKYCS